MSRHRRPAPRPPLHARPTVRIAAVGTAAAALTVASLVGIADNIGDEFTPAAHTTPTISRPVDDDPGQRGMRGLPVPARIFPTDLNAPDYAIGDGDTVTAPPTAALSAPPRACRCAPRLPVPAETVPEAPEAVQTVAAPEQTVTEPPTQAAEPTADPTTTEPDQPEETTAVTEEPTVTDIDELTEEVAK